jgi:hypothetical protein
MCSVFHVSLFREMGRASAVIQQVSPSRCAGYPHHTRQAVAA